MATATPSGRQSAASVLAVREADSKMTEAERPETGYMSSVERSRRNPSR
jgi:hypothetical protein